MLVRDLSELGFLPDERETFERWLVRPHGLVVVTGPTGSGKTTTLYSALQALASPEVNVVTIEDPIEMVHEDFNQIAANPKTGTSFAEALRHVLRQDPDVIMVGEVRDAETATQAVQAALTGHLVLTTLHTNDAVGAVARLRDLGVPQLPHRRHAHRGGGAAAGARRSARPAPRTCRSPPTRWPSWACRHPEDHAGELLARRGAGLRQVPLHRLLRPHRPLRDPRRSTPGCATSSPRGPPPRCWPAPPGRTACARLREHAVRKVAAGATSFEEAMRATADAEGTR